MIMYLKYTKEALLTLIITSTTDISNSDTCIITCGTVNKIHRLINIKTIGEKNKTNNYMK